MLANDTISENWKKNIVIDRLMGKLENMFEVFIHFIDHFAKIVHLCKNSL
jgi:hypothetical protein